MASGAGQAARPRELPLLEIRKRVLFPGVLLRLQIGRPKSVRLVESIWDSNSRSFKKGSMLAVCTVQGDASEREGGPDGVSAKSSDAKALPEVAPPHAAGGVGKGVVDSHPVLELLDGADKCNVYTMGTVARVLQLSRVNSTDNQSFQFSLLVEGVARVRVDEVSRHEPFNVAKVSWLADEGSVNDTEVRALAINVRELARDLLELQRKRNSPLGKKTKEVVDNLDRASPGRLADLLSANLDASVSEKQAVLGELDLVARLRRALELMNRQVEVFKISDKIQNEVEGKLKNSQREYYLRQQMRAINEELGQISGKGAGEGDELDALEESLAKARLPEEAKQTADRELQRLRQMQPQQPEYSVLRTYLELMADLPWSVTTKDNLDIRNARAVLDADHHALDKVKKRIVEFLAVRSLKNDMKGPILCLVGPPGVGKTSLGKSVADALGRKFRRMALGGVRDEAEIRGHRRTYIGAMPGSIIQTLKKAGSSNPVMLLDEVDKLGRDVRGDPGSALLEVLDPEQNDSFVDHYLNVPFDLSKVMFIATANRLDTIPGPLLDRMEVIELPGYTQNEKHEIAVKHLVPKQMQRHGIDLAHIEVTPRAVDFIISSYTREAGVRSLDREIASVCRYAAVKVAESRDRETANVHKEVEEGAVAAGGLQSLQQQQQQQQEQQQHDKNNTAQDDHTNRHAPANANKGDSKQVGKEVAVKPVLQLESSFKPLVVTPEMVQEVLGPPRFESEVAQRTAVPGVATGMAWTQVGGEILFIEAWLHRGQGRVQLTGQLGSVMQESVRAALSFIRGNLYELGLAQQLANEGDLQQALSYADLHVHFPAGAVPKDGPSAGVAVTAAILSALTGRCVRSDTACTGEITLRGLVLPVGGIKEKVLAAHRAGIKRIVLPKRNAKDAREIPEEVLQQLEVIYAENIIEAVGHLFDGELTAPIKAPRWLEEVREEMRSKATKPRRASQPINPMEPDDTLRGEHGFKSRNIDLVGPADIKSLL
jgi:ATP-dependent Lon protease